VATLPSSGEGVRGTRSIPALTAYFRAHEALASWQLDSAETLFRSAIDLDPKYPHANYWLAQVMAWRGDEATQWLPNAERAVELSTRLSRRDSTIAVALLDLAQGQFPEACARYEQLRAGKDSLDFAVWYGLGDCRARDTVIVKSASSPSGWRFRSSYAAAIGAYTRALTLVPSAHRAFAGVGFERLSQLLFTQRNQVRRGAVESDSTVWAAFPSLVDDSLTFVPYPYAALATGRAAQPSTTTAAVARNRRLLERLATGWTRDFPRSAPAFEALARTLELEGRITGGATPDASALAALDRARALATDHADLRRLGVMRTRLLLISGDFGSARSLADSMLAAAANNDPAEADTLKSLAALTGHVQRTIDLLRTEAPTVRFLSSNGRIIQPPLPVTEAARAMLGYVSLGAPIDSIGASQQHVEHALDSYVPNDQRSFVRATVLSLPLRLAYPVTPATSLAREGGVDDYLLNIQRAASRQDAPAVRAMLHAINSTRGLEQPGELSIYYTYQEAWLLLQVGDTAAATRELDASLNALPSLGQDLLDYVQETAFLVRAMVLRSDLAAKSGDDKTAGRWGAAVAELWAGADPSLQTVVARMRTRADEIRR
jgi:tetratricopeptide (TPR) repeat protein